MAVRVVCISHATGAGGAAIAQSVAERLGFRYVDDEIVGRAAAEGGIESRDVADEERRKSLARRVLDALGQGTGGGAALGPSGPVADVPPDEMGGAEIRALIRETIVQTAARGDVVIGSHAAAHALEGQGGTLRVLVTASPSTRVSRIADAEGIDEAAAERAMKASDAGRRDYLRRFYDIGDEQATQYDLVINTDRFSVDQAAEIIVGAAAG